MTIIIYSIAVPGGISASDPSKYVGIIFWGITLVVSVYPVVYLIFNRKNYNHFDNLKFLLIAIFCPFVGSLYLYFKMSKEREAT
jgi:hypothetical protein